MRDYRLAFWFCIWNDMGCIKQLTVSQTTESTLMLIGEKNTLAECPPGAVDAVAKDVTYSRRTSAIPPGGLSRLRKEINLDSIVNRD